MLSLSVRPFVNVALRTRYQKIRYCPVHWHVLSSVMVPRKVLQLRSFGRSKSLSSKSMKVALLGAANNAGRCLSLFLKQSPLIDELAIYDKESTYGIALELSYINTKCTVSTYTSKETCLEETLQDAKIVMIVSDLTLSKHSKPDVILKTNADTLSDLLPAVIKFCPRAMVAITMYPVNSLIPLAIEMYKKAGIFEYNRIFGVTTLDCVRANTFMSEVIGIEPECVSVPVIGGSCPETCIPIFSQAKPRKKLTEEEVIRLTHAVRMPDDIFLKLNGGKGTSCFATAFAAARFCASLCKALHHQSEVVENAYVRSCVIPEVTYFAAPLQLGLDGIQKHLGIPSLNDYECKLLESAIPALKKAIAHGEALALGQKYVTSETCVQHLDSRYKAVRASQDSSPTL